MTKILRKRVMGSILTGIIVSIFFLAMAFLTNSAMTKYLTAKDYRQMDSIDAGQIASTGNFIKGENLVKFDINMVIDYFALDNNGYYYFAPCGDNTYIMIYVRNEDVDEFDKTCLATQKYFAGNSELAKWKGNHARGALCSVTEDEEQYFYQFLNENLENFYTIGMNADSRLEPFSIYYTKMSKWMNTPFYLFIGAAAIFLIITFISAATMIPRFKSQLNKKGLDYSDVDYDIGNGTKFSKYTVFGNRYFAISKFMGIEVSEINKLVWAYKHTTRTTHTMYGVIKTGVTYDFRVTFADEDGNTYWMSCGKNERLANRILRHLSENTPIVVGYSDELAQMYTYNRAEFTEQVRSRRTYYENSKY